MKTLILIALFMGQIITGHYRKPSGNPGPVAAWPMNEGSGLVFNDVSGNGNTATLNTAVTWQSNAGFPGITPLFNGTQRATSTSTTLLNFPATQAFTVGFCTNVNSSSSGSTFASTLATNAAPFTGWEVSTNGGAGGSLFEFYLINNYPSNAINVSAPRPDGALKYIVVTYSGFFNGTRFPASDVAVYYNGVAQTVTIGTDTLTGDPRSGGPLRIGQRSTTGAFLNGAMAFLEVWPYAQSSTTVAANSALACGIH